jgi:ABC-type Na+ efflux pump permease subunit
LNLRDIWTLYSSEIRALLRERTIVVNSILIPILLYPLMIWMALTAFTVVASQTERFVSRIELAGLPSAHPALLEAFEDQERIELSIGADNQDSNEATLAQARTRVRQGEIDAFVLFEELSDETGGVETSAGSPADGLGPSELVPTRPGLSNFRAHLVIDSSKERSTTAQNRVESLIGNYRRDWLDRQALETGLSIAEWQVFDLREENLATSEDMGNFMLGLMLPIMFVIMVAIGCFYPAVDATAGERERNTWETTFSMATSRINIVLAKYLVVATFGCIGGFLNVAAMVISMRTMVASLLAREGAEISFSVTPTAIPVLLLAAILLAGFVAAGMMIFASFARTFREGQSMVTPFYLVILIPIMLLNDPGLVFTRTLALTPIANVALVLRSAFIGSVDGLLLSLTVVSSLVAIFLMLLLATWILRFEDVVTGSFDGSFVKFLSKQFGR